MATITIKFKDTLTLGTMDTINIGFVSNGINYSSIGTQEYPGNIGLVLKYDNTIVYGSNNYENTAFQYITLDTNQTNFNTFITAMKDNIEGVLLESGTYKWVDFPYHDGSYLTLVAIFDFVSNSQSFSECHYYQDHVEGSLQQSIFYSSPNNFVFNNNNDPTWTNDAYKTITTDTDQYIDYDFYNYAILGNQLVKQEPTPTGVNNLRFGSDTPTKLYVGDTEITKAYMGDTLVYEKWGDNMALYTETLYDYLNNGNTLPAVFDEIEGFSDLFAGFYFDREIGFETEEIFKHKLEAFANVYVPIFKEKIALHAKYLTKLDNPAKTFYEKATTKINLGETKARLNELPFVEPIDAALTPQPSSVSSTDAVENNNELQTFKDASVDESLRILDKLNEGVSNLTSQLLKAFNPLFMAIF